MYGVLATGVLSLMAGALFLLAADAVRMRRRDRQRGPGAVFAFYVVFGCLLLLAGLRLFVALAALRDPAWIVTDRFLFLAVCACAALAFVPLMHLAVQVLTGDRRAAAAAAIAFGLLAALGFWGVLDGGLHGPQQSRWNIDWEIQSRLTIVVLAVGGLVPALCTAALIHFQARHLVGAERRRAEGVAASLYLYFLILMLGALGVHGWWVLLERGVYLAAGYVAWQSQRHTTFFGAPTTDQVPARN